MRELADLEREVELVPLVQHGPSLADPLIGLLRLGWSVQRVAERFNMTASEVLAMTSRYK